MGKLTRWWSAFVAVNQGPGPHSAPGYNFYPVRPIRTEGAGGMVLQVLTELPLRDASGPTISNAHAIVLQGAVFPPRDPSHAIGGVFQGVFNADQLGVNGLLEPYDPLHAGQSAG